MDLKIKHRLSSGLSWCFFNDFYKKWIKKWGNAVRCPHLYFIEFAFRDIRSWFRTWFQEQCQFRHPPK